jgi:prepilin-type N-terminal cleavage/methylation domain-containing protein
MQFRATQLHRQSFARRRARSGFTLAEVLVTMVLMAIVLPVALRGVSIASGMASNARRSSEAAMLAQGLLAEMVASGDPTIYPTSGDFGQAWPGYTWTTQNVDDVEYGVLRMTVIVQWTDRGQPRNLSVSTMYSYSTDSATTGLP